MTTYAYKEILELFQSLTPEEQVRLLEDLDALIGGQRRLKSQHNIMEFEGFAAELWKDVDVEKYIEEERNSWNG